MPEHTVDKSARRDPAGGGPFVDLGDGEYVSSRPSHRFPVYTRGNAGEVYPEVTTPLSYSLAFEAGEQAMRNAFIRTGLTRPGDFDEEDTAVTSGVFGGYAYLNLSFNRVIATRMPGGRAEDVDRAYMGAADPPPHDPHPDDRSLRASLRGLRYLWRTVRIHDLPELEGDVRRVEIFTESLADPVTATDDELRDTLIGFSEFFAGLFETHLVISGQAGVAVAGLARHCEQKFGDPGLANQLLGGIGEVESAAPSTALWDLGRMVRDDPLLTAEFDAGVNGLLTRLDAAPGAEAFLTRFGDFLARYGSRGPNEWDTYFDTWETAPEMALALVDRMRTAEPDHEPALRSGELGGKRRELEARLGQRLRGPSRRLFHRLTTSSRVLSQGRERSKTTVIAAIHAVRLRALELDRRVTERSGGSPRDMWFVTVDELDDYLTNPLGFADLIAERRRVREMLSALEPPFFFHGEIPPPREWVRRDRTTRLVAAGTELEGLPGCPGLARGRARVVTDPSDPGSLGPGDVLVAPITDPSWTPLFVPAEAVVVDVGAVMSHAVIVSRELGIPCVVSVTDATRTIPDGALIEVDGDKGTVRIIELP